MVGLNSAPLILYMPHPLCLHEATTISPLRAPTIALARYTKSRALFVVRSPAFVCQPSSGCLHVAHICSFCVRPYIFPNIPIARMHAHVPVYPFMYLVVRKLEFELRLDRRYSGIRAV